MLGGALVFYTDVHSHLLFGADDGAETETEMYAMLDAAYASGTRALCLTPHYQPRYYGHNGGRADHAMSLLTAYAKEKYPDMTLALANELGYYTECERAVADGSCRLLGGRYLLMDFLPRTPLFTIRYAVDEMLSAGYHLVLAHIERYEALKGEEDLIAEWASRGALLQVNASAFARKMPFFAKRRIKKLMKRELIHMVASDAHDLSLRPPSLAEAEEVITDRFGADIARLLLSAIPSDVMAGKRI